MLHVVLPVHNRAAITATFLSDLRMQTIVDYRLVLVDDGCTDQTLDIARAALNPDQLVVLQGNGQLWWAGALQMAYRHLVAKDISNDDVILIINDDVRIEPDFLARGLAALRAQPTGCVQAVGIDQATGIVDRGAIFDARRLSFRAAAPGEAPTCLSTRGLLMNALTFVASGGFRPRWLPHYLSDYEFTIRLSRSGVPLVVDESFSLVADHNTSGEQQFTGNGLRNFLRHALSNRAKYNPKHWSAFALLVCPPMSAVILVARIWAAFALRSLRIALRSSPATR